MVSGSLIGGIKQTQEMLDFCGEKGITASIEKIPIDYVNTAYERMLRSDVRYRWVEAAMGQADLSILDMGANGRHCRPEQAGAATGDRMTRWDPLAPLQVRH